MKRLGLFLLMLIAACAISAQVSTENYIRTRRMLSNNGDSYMDEISYYDGLGRPYQSVQRAVRNNSAVNLNLITLQEYDAAGREGNTWLPIPAGSSLYLSPDAFKSQAPGKYGNDSRPYSQPIYEASPLVRVMAKYGPGAAWYTAGRNTKIEYLTNESSIASERHCRFYTVDASGNLTGHNTTYASGELHVVKNTDEDLNTTYTFTDKQGRTLLERRMAATGMHDTYYVYDSFDRLRFVLQPMYQENPDLTKYAFRYIYDGRGRCIRKKLPGAGEVEYRYNSLNQLTYSQDGNQRAASRWTFYEYDAQARLVRQGESTGSTPSNNGTVHIVNFYDNYSFIGTSGFTATQYTADTSGYGRGALTGSIISLLDGSGTKLYIAYYYDIKGRMLKTVQNNLLGGYDVTGTNYTFSDKPASVMQAHTASGKTARTAVHIYTYDHANRISKVQHLLNSTTLTLYDITYDDIGRLATKSLHGSSANKLTYTYNVRSWLTGITGTKFAQNLYYNTGVGTAKYNGGISSMTWKAGTESTVRGYKFSYDGLDRMQNATYGETASINTNTNRFSENVTAYDKNGNIKTLQRYGQTSASAYGLLDNLTYTLTGNQLNRVDDAVTTAAYGTNTAFVNGASAAGEYAYDANGNLTQDLNKGITGITYNVLNLPSVITFSDKSTITYTYAADGTKLRTVHKIGSTTTTTDYCGNVIYENGIQKFLLTEEGYVNLTGTQQYHYYLKDHQGNNRVVINQDGTVEETNHYYSFGGLFASTTVQPYKYNGKEYDTKKGLNWYDYGARMYDPVLGRFTTVDPLAEKYYSTSPYTYCGNNPVGFSDLDGCMKVIYNADGTYKETTHNNWFHNTFMGRQEYVDNGNDKVRLSEQEFWNWQETGQYGSIQSTDDVTNFEFRMEELATGVADGVAKFVLSSAYSVVNSPKVMLTGRTWAGASQTSTERIGSFIDVVSNYLPVSKMGKVGNPGSWYNFKHSNKHIPISKRKSAFDAEIRRYKGKTKNTRAFENIKEPLGIIHYLKEKEEQ